MKTLFKGLIAFTIALLFIYVGAIGFEIQQSDTTGGWQLWGFFLSSVLIVPSSLFWLKQVAWVIDLKEEEGGGDGK